MSTYRTIYWKVLLPLYETLRKRSTFRLLKESEKRQWLPVEQIAAFQLIELQKLVQHAATNSPWYRERLKKLGITPEDIRSINDYRKLPLLSKNDIRQHREEMLADNFRDRVMEHKTGGSTGEPVRFYRTRKSYEWRCAVSMRGYSWASCWEGERHFYVWGAPIGKLPLATQIKTKLHNLILRRRMFSSFGFSDPAMAECIRQINRFRPKTIIGYTNALHLLAQHILNTQSLHHRPKAVITAAEGVNPVQRTTIEHAFGVPVFASYGSREFMLIAMECEQHKGLHLSADNLLVEIVKPDGSAAKEGEVGEILVTDLHNYGMPFIRYKIGDMGVATARVCPCGRGLPLLERVEGRVLDVIRTSDGRIVPGEFFPHLMKEFDAIRQFQVIQKRLDHLEIKLVLIESSETAGHLARIEQEVRSMMGDSIHIDFQRVQEIPQTTSGKFRVTVSELNHS